MEDHFTLGGGGVMDKDPEVGECSMGSEISRASCEQGAQNKLRVREVKLEW